MPTRDDLAGSFFPVDPAPAVGWTITDGPVDYEDAVAIMEHRAEAIARGEASEWVWLVEHPALYTAGTSSRPDDLIAARFPVHQTGRGGQYTYHGPGQRVAYVMLDLKRRRPDVRAFVAALEDWIVATLASFNLRAGRREARVGVWVDRPDKPPSVSGLLAEDKIAAIGIRLRRWVSFHGISINVEPDLEHFSSIVPCGIADAHLGVTSLVDLGLPVTMADVDVALRQSFAPIFGASVDETQSRSNGVANRGRTPATGPERNIPVSGELPPSLGRAEALGRSDASPVT